MNEKEELRSANARVRKEMSKRAEEHGWEMEKLKAV
jgi:hypothetical protein